LSCWSSRLGVLALALLLGGACPTRARQQPGSPHPPPLPVPARHPPPPAPPPLDRTEVANQINRIHYQLAQGSQRGRTEKSILSEANACLERAQKQLARNQVFAASRLAEAAEELSHALDQLQRRGDPAEVTLPPRLDLHRHLIEVYFRVRQADYFYQQSRDKSAQTLAELARRFYQQARQAFDQQHPGPAMEYADAADDMVRALEFLAQSAVKANAPPPLAIGRKR
jgi:hypothetical protein